MNAHVMQYELMILCGIRLDLNEAYGKKWKDPVYKALIKKIILKEGKLRNQLEGRTKWTQLKINLINLYFQVTAK